MPPQPSASTLALPNFSSSRRRRRRAAPRRAFSFWLRHHSYFFSLYALLSELFLMTSTLDVKTLSMVKVA